MAEDRRLTSEGISEGVGLALVVATVLGWASLAQIMREPPVNIPAANVMVLRP